MVAAAIDELGRLDFLVSDAGIPATREPIPPKSFGKMTEEFWATILSTTFSGLPLHPRRRNALRAAGGTVCNTASIAGLGTEGSSIAYGASKAALINLTKNLARALARGAGMRRPRPRRHRLDETRGPRSASARRSTERCSAASARRGHRHGNRLPLRRRHHVPATLVHHQQPFLSAVKPNCSRLTKLGRFFQLLK